MIALNTNHLYVYPSRVSLLLFYFPRSVISLQKFKYIQREKAFQRSTEFRSELFSLTLRGYMRVLHAPFRRYPNTAAKVEPAEQVIYYI